MIKVIKSRLINNQMVLKLGLGWGQGYDFIFYDYILPYN
jgi:hypothetical protein